MSYECGVCEASHHVEHAPDCPHHPNNAGVQPVDSVQQNEPNDKRLAKKLEELAWLLQENRLVDQGKVQLVRLAASRLSGGQQSVTLEQVREAFDAQLVVDARIPPEVESAFGAYVTQLRDRVIGWLETAGLSDMERE